MLTPKVQKDFTRWALKQPYFKKGTPHIGIEKTESDLYFNTTPFKKLPIAAQFGIYQDYFREAHNLLINLKSDVVEDGKVIFIFEIVQPQEITHDNTTVYMSVEMAVSTPSLSIDKNRKTAIQEASKLAEDKL